MLIINLYGDNIYIDLHLLSYHILFDVFLSCTFAKDPAYNELKPLKYKESDAF